MKFTVIKPTEIDVATIRITFPLSYDGEDGSMSKDFPCRGGVVWQGIVELETGRIINWPNDKMGDYDCYEKVTDMGIYELLDKDGAIVADIRGGYVPHGVVPGEYGDYIEFHIRDGVITNWPRKIDVSDFFSES